MDLNVKKKYMIFNLVNAVTKDNRPYLRMVLSDEEGSSINAIMFDSNKLDFTPEKGSIVEVAGMLQQYNGTAQLKISSMEQSEAADKDAFLPKSAHDPAVMRDELKSVLKKHVKSSYFKKLYETFTEDEAVFDLFTVKPAAKSVHHAYIHGLLEHTLSMVKLSAIVADYYGKDVNKELLMMGALFHDIGKVMEIDSESAFEYTDEGKLLGHLLLGIELVNGYIAGIEDFPRNARFLLTHLIASHHGLLEFGSPKLPQTKEAILLHLVDNMDAKLAACDSIFEKEDVKTGGWSSYDRLMERQLFRHGLMPE